ncbi:MAG: UrcA family protein [Sphingorhabdus sp.]
MATPKLIPLSIAAASLLAISTPALADTKVKQVKHEDLDLSTANGQQRLKVRVKQAVKQVCGSPRAMTLRDRLDQNQCEAKAMANAMPKAERAIATYAERLRLASRKSPIVAGN